jgi:hypothetical protein
LKGWWRGEGGEEMVNWALGGADARGSESLEKTDRVVRVLAKWMRARREAGRKEEEKSLRERIHEREKKQKRKKKNIGGKERRRQEKDKEDREEAEERAEKKRTAKTGRRVRAERRRGR